MKSLFLALCVFYTASAYVDYTGDQVFRVQVKDEDQLELLQTFGRELELDFWHEARQAGGHADIQAPKARISAISSWLQEQGFDFSVMVADVGKLISQERKPRSVQPDTSRLDFYRTLEEVEQWIDDIVDEFSDLVTVIDVATSYEGRTIRLLKISTGPSRPAFWMDSGIHAREWVAPASNIYYTDQLLRNYGVDDEITALIDEMDFYILPVFNVDGYEYTWTDDRMWRKTRSPIANSTCIGTDPNRNWDFMWGEVNVGGPCSATYPGSGPFSEVEVAEVADFMASINNLLGVLAIHSYGQMYMVPYGHTEEPNPDFDEQMELCDEANAALYAVHGEVYRCDSLINLVGPNSGGSADYVYEILGVKFSFGVELRDTGTYGFVLPENQIIPTAEENFEAVKVIARGVLEAVKH